MRATVLLVFTHISFFAFTQNRWQKVDSAFGPLPTSLHVYYTEQPVDSAPFRAYCVVAELKDKRLRFDTDTTLNRRLTPQKFFERNKGPLVVVNGTFFSFETSRNLNLVIKESRMVSHGPQVRRQPKDSTMYVKHLTSALGISKSRKADVAWVYTDSAMRWPIAFQRNPEVRTDESLYLSKYTFVPELHHYPKSEKRRGIDEAWKMQTAIGGGPVLIQEGKMRITNDEEFKFGGKALRDKHPRTAMGYTADNKLVILVVEGRNKTASGATLPQLAQLLLELGCVEALNLDGGGSSCLLVNGKETIKPSDPAGQRAVPAVFVIMKNE